MIELLGTRVRLVALDQRHLTILKEQGRTEMEKALGLQPSQIQHALGVRNDLKEALAFWVAYSAAHPESFAWGTNWEIVHMTENRTIGGIGLAGFPDFQGVAVLGYAIDVNYHNRGYASESLALLADWAFKSPDLRFLRAYTPVDNYASQQVLQKNQFVRRGEENDLVIWERKAAERSD